MSARSFLISTCILLSLLGSAAAQSQSSDGKLAGAVSEVPEGAPLPSSFVLIHAFGGKEDIRARPDDAGRFEVSLSAGMYYIFVADPGFVPWCKAVKILSGKTTNLEIKLRFDSENAEE